MNRPKPLKTKLFYKQPARILLFLKNNTNKEWTIRELYRELDMTHSHCVNIINQFKEHSIVTKLKNGVAFKYQLTPTGMQIASNLQTISNLIK